MSICGSGIETYLRPWRPIISPCDIYLRRSFLILPRTIWRKRLRSRSARLMDIVASGVGGWGSEVGGWSYLLQPPTPDPWPLVLGIAARKDAGDVVQHIGGALIVVAEIADQARLDHI